MSEPDVPGIGIVKHKGGSRSAVATAAKLRRDGVSAHEIGYAVFKTFHESDGSYSDAKSTRIDAEIQRRRAEVLHGVHRNHDAIVHDVVGVDKKKRVLGQGSRSRSLAYSSIGSSIHPGSSQIDADAISHQVEEQVAKRVVEIERRMEEKEKAMEEKEKAREEKINSLEATVVAMRAAQEA